MFKKIVLIVAVIGFLGLLHAMEKASSFGTITLGKVIGGYYYTGHALERMVQREVDASDVAWVIGHGNRYNTFDSSKPLAPSRQLCVDTKKKLGVIIDRYTNNVITVLTGMGQQRLKTWIAQHTPTKEERMALVRQYVADIKQLQRRNRFSRAKGFEIS